MSRGDVHSDEVPHSTPEVADSVILEPARDEVLELSGTEINWYIDRNHI